MAKRCNTRNPFVIDFTIIMDNNFIRAAEASCLYFKRDESRIIRFL